ncbi:hypothetical protein L6R50_17605 [Myxococcota bacterium]|nr:hypothetical protein [Myxococcota bacterium]
MTRSDDALRETLQATREVADALEEASRGDDAQLRRAVLRAVERLRALRALPPSVGDWPLPDRGGPRVV